MNPPLTPQVLAPTVFSKRYGVSWGSVFDAPRAEKVLRGLRESGI
jgi:hypothetical protein